MPDLAAWEVSKKAILGEKNTPKIAFLETSHAARSGNYNLSILDDFRRVKESVRMASISHLCRHHAYFDGKSSVFLEMRDFDR